MLAATPVTVKLSDDQQVVIRDNGIELQDARSYSPRLIAAMNLEDAVAVAQAILELQKQAEEDAWIDRMYEYELEKADAELFNRECSIEDDYTWIAQGC